MISHVFQRSTRAKSNSAVKMALAGYVKYVLALFCLLLIVSLVRNILMIRRANKEIAKEAEKVEKLAQENTKLQESIEGAKSDYFIESQLRDKLGYVKEGETVVVLPSEDKIKQLATQINESPDTLPPSNWQKWLRLFL